MSGRSNEQVIAMLCSELQADGAHVLPAVMAATLDRIGLRLMAVPAVDEREAERPDVTTGKVRMRSDEIKQSEFRSVPANETHSDVLGSPEELTRALDERDRMHQRPGTSQQAVDATMREDAKAKDEVAKK